MTPLPHSKILNYLVGSLVNIFKAELSTPRKIKRNTKKMLGDLLKVTQTVMGRSGDRLFFFSPGRTAI
jgi:hypothetical protein